MLHIRRILRHFAVSMRPLRDCCRIAHSPQSQLITRSLGRRQVSYTLMENDRMYLSNRGAKSLNDLFSIFFPKSYLRVTRYVRTHPMHIDCPFSHFNQYLPALSPLVRDFRSRNQSMHLRAIYTVQVMKKLSYCIFPGICLSLFVSSTLH